MSVVRILHTNARYLVKSSSHECVKAKGFFDEVKVLVSNLDEGFNIALRRFGCILVPELSNHIQSSLFNVLLENSLDGTDTVHQSQPQQIQDWIAGAVYLERYKRLLFWEL